MAVRRPRFRLASLCAAIAAWLLAQAGSGDAYADDAGLVFAVKATYLYKFAPFIVWPDLAQHTRFDLCIIGDSPDEGVLNQAVHGESVGGRPIVIRHFQSVASDPGCQMVYATGSDAQPVPAILAVFRGRPVLTVTDGQTVADAKGIINFVLAGNRVRFEINGNAAAANGLVISSKLMSLAVRDSSRG